MSDLAGIITGFGGIHIDVGVSDNCQNMMESYGEICVECNKCGRFNKEEQEVEE